MRLIFIFMEILLIIVDIVIYIRIKKYCKEHENELLDKHRNYIFARMVWIVILGVLVGVLGLIVQFL